MPHIRLIGDVHGKIAPRPKSKERNVRDLFPTSPYKAQHQPSRCYKNLIEPATYSVQVGDLGYDYQELENVDPVNHRVIGGNHEDYASLTAHFLGDYGSHSFPLASGDFLFFFIRGAMSVDKDRRTRGWDWFPEEELTVSQAAKAIAAFEKAKPAIMTPTIAPAASFRESPRTRRN